MITSMNRRELLQKTAAAGAVGAIATSRHDAYAQNASPAASPVASPMASPVAMDPAFQSAQDELLADLKGNYAGKKIRMLSGVAGGKTPEEDKLWADEFKRLTGIELELVHPSADYDTKLMADLGAGVQYDLIYTNKQFVDVLVAEEALTDLTEKINASAILSNPTVIPTEEWEMVNYDGKYYTVFNKFEGSRMLTIRKDWLDKLGLDEPKTLDDLYNVMVAFRDNDPVGDGSKPLGFSTTGTYDIQPFMSSAGLAYGYQQDTDAKVIPYATDAAIPAYEFLAKIYAEGLYDPDFATQEMADVRNKFMTDKLGMLCYWDTWIGLFNAQVKLASPESPFIAAGVPAAEDADGEVHITRGQPSVWTIPVNANDPDTAFKVLEWWHTIPGITLGTLGIEGHDYTVTDGTYALTQIGQEHGMDHGAPTPYNGNWHNPIGELPGLKEAQALTKQYAKLDYEGSDWEPTIKPILDENIVKIILGDLSAADGVAAMQDALKSKGMID